MRRRRRSRSQRRGQNMFSFLGYSSAWPRLRAAFWWSRNCVDAARVIAHFAASTLFACTSRVARAAFSPKPRDVGRRCELRAKASESSCVHCVVSFLRSRLTSVLISAARNERDGRARASTARFACCETNETQSADKGNAVKLSAFVLGVLSRFVTRAMHLATK